MEALGLTHGVFHTPVGSEGPGPLLPGQSYTFAVDATTPSPTRLSFAFHVRTVQRLVHRHRGRRL